MNAKFLRAGLSLLFGVAVGECFAQSGGSFQIVAGQISGGGETGRAGDLTLQSSFLSYDLHRATGGAYVLEGGLRAVLSPIPLSAPCALECPPDLSVPCTDADGAIVNYPLPQLRGECPPGSQVECVPPTGSRFALGTTPVHCKVLNSEGGTVTECQFNVTVECRPFEIHCPSDIQVTMTQPGRAVVDYPMPTVSGVGAPLTLECIPPPGSKFGLGVTPVVCTAWSDDGSSATCTFYVYVTTSLSSCLEFQCPSNIVVDCTIPGGVPVNYPLPAGTNICEETPLQWVCHPPPGTTFPPGTSTVQCWGSPLGLGEFAYCEFTVTVKGKCPDPCLVLSCPTNRIVPCTGPRGSVVNYEFTATNRCNSLDLFIRCTPPSGSVFPPGATEVECVAWGSGQTNRCSFSVVVETNCAPSIDWVSFGREFVITWPATAAGYVLQQTTNLFGDLEDSGNEDRRPHIRRAQREDTVTWQNVPTPPVRIGDFYSVSPSIPEGPMIYYRLFRLPRFDAEIVEVRFYTNLIGGARRSWGIVTARNTGDATWTAEGNGRCMLGVPNARADSLWSPTHRVPLPTDAVAPGQTVDIYISIDPPAIPGEYSLEWRLLQEFDDGIEWFGDSFFYRPITIEFVAFPERIGRASQPLVATNLDARLEVFLDLTHWRQLAQSGPWSGLEALHLEAPPSDWGPAWRPGIAVSINRDGRLELFVRSAGVIGLSEPRREPPRYFHSWQRARGGQEWTAGEPFHRHFFSTPVVAQNADGRLEVFGISGDGFDAGRGPLLHNWQIVAGGAWDSTWPSLESIELRYETPIFVARDSQGHLHVCYRDGTQLKHLAQTGVLGTWSGVESLPGPPGGLTDSMAVTVIDGRIEVVALAGDGSLWNTRREPGPRFRWYEWSRLLARDGGHPVIGEDYDGRRDIFMLGPDRSLRRLAHRSPTGPWATEAEHLGGGGRLLARPAVGRNADGRLEVFAIAEFPAQRTPEGIADREYRLVRRKQIRPGSWQ